MWAILKPDGFSSTRSVTDHYFGSAVWAGGDVVNVYGRLIARALNGAMVAVGPGGDACRLGTTAITASQLKR